MWTWDSTEIDFSQTCWTFDGYDGCAQPKPKSRMPVYPQPYDNSLREAEIARIQRMDNEIIDTVIMLITKGLI